MNSGMMGALAYSRAARDARVEQLRGSSSGKIPVPDTQGQGHLLVNENIPNWASLEAHLPANAIDVVLSVP